MSTFLKMSDLQIKTLYSQINKIKIELSANDDVKYRQKKTMDLANYNPD